MSKLVTLECFFSQLEERLNVLLAQLANCWRTPIPLQLQQDPELDYQWQQFCQVIHYFITIFLA